MVCHVLPYFEYLHLQIFCTLSFANELLYKSLKQNFKNFVNNSLIVRMLVFKKYRRLQDRVPLLMI